MSRRYTKKLISLAFTLLLAIAATIAYAWSASEPPKPMPHPGMYSVTKTIDGDTIEVNMAGKQERIRMIGVDTPETKKPNAPVQCFGHEASDFTKRILAGKSVRLEADPMGDNRDRYNRLLRYVYMDNQLFNQQLIEQGYAFAYLSFPFSKHRAFANAQKQAQANNLGLWKQCQPTSNGSRWQSNDLP